LVSKIKMESMNRYGVIIFLFVFLLLGSLILIYPEATVTGLAAGSSSRDSADGLIKAALNSINKDSMKKAYNANSDIVSRIISRAEKSGVDPYLAVALIYHESRFDVNALRCEKVYESGRSGPYKRNVEKYDCAQYDCDKLVNELRCYSGCNSKQISTYGSFHQVSCSYGLGQLMYPTACGLGFKGSGDELMNPDKNIELTILLIKKLVDKYNGDIPYALAEYNAGIVRVNKCKSDDFSKFYSCLPAVTRKYIPHILASAIVFKDYLGGIDLRDDYEYAEDVMTTYKIELPTLEESAVSTISAKPNFKHTVPYSFSEYEIIKKDAQELLDSCTDILHVEKCIEKKLKEYNRKYLQSDVSFQWHYEDACVASHETYSESMVKFLGYIDSCIQSETTYCYCKPGYLIDSRSQLSQEYANVNIKHTKGGAIEEYVYRDLRIVSTILVDGQHHLGISKEGELMQADSTLPECVTQIKNNFRFCVQSNQKIPIMDNGKVIIEPVLYRFALSFSDNPEKKQEYNSPVMTFYSNSDKISLITKVGETK
jgi:hypothetical protein